MTNRILRHGTFAALVLSLAACNEKKSDDVLAQDSSLSRDIALANNDSLAQPELRDVPAGTPAVAAPSAVARRQAPSEILTPRGPAPRIVRSQPKRAAQSPIPAPQTTENGNTVSLNAAGSERAMGTIASGSSVGLYSGQRVCTNTNSVGDRFTASVAEAVQGSNGVAIPAGATVVMEITALKRSTNPNDDIEMEFAPRSISFNGKTYPVSSTVTFAQVDRVRAETRGDDARKVATGAVIGAIAGQILGRKTRSTVIGAATGAAAGAINAAVTAHVDGCVPNGGRISLRLNQAVVVQAG